MTEQEAHELLKKYHAGECTPDEAAQLHKWYGELLQQQPLKPYDATDYELHGLWRSIETQSAAIHSRPKRRLYWPIAAAVALIFGLGSAFYLLYLNKPQVQQQVAAHDQDKQPGRNVAVLTLANGQQVQLDSTTTGVVATQEGVTVTRGANGQLVYRANATTNGAGTNTLTTPRGGQFQVYLPDGSMVYLNAASSLTFPVAFNGAERSVTMRGEGYFEIAKDPKKPFKVTTGSQTVEVLGTHFNIAGYDDEPLVTTLAEGKVKVSISSSSKSITLKPDDQSTVADGGITVAEVNAADVIAWKDGSFIFSNSSLKDVLRQISRWYDVEVDYATIPDTKLNSEISRKETLRGVLRLIERTSGVALTYEGRRIMKK